MALDRSTHLVLPRDARRPALAPPRQAAVAKPAAPADPWTGATPAQRQRVQEILSFLRAVDDLLARGVCCTHDQAAAHVRNRRGDNYLILHAGRQQAGRRSLLTGRNEREWRRQLGRRRGSTDYDNYPALLDGYCRGDRGRKGADAWWELFYGVYLTGNGQHLRESYRDACRQWRGLGMPEVVGGSPAVPKRAHVEYWHRQYGDRYAADYARRGESWFRTHACGWIERDWEDVRVGEIWVGDHRKLDILLQGERADGTPWPMRAWVTAWRDARSGKILSWRLYGTWDEEPNAIAIIHTFFDAYRGAGHLPEALYIDNGKDFCKAGFTTPIEIGGKLVSACMAVGVDVIKAIKYNARAKTIERTFLDLADHSDRKFPSYIGNSPATRREDAWKLARKNVDRLPTLDDVSACIQDWVWRYEHSTESMSRITGGIPVCQLWDGHAPPRPPVPIEDVRRGLLLPTAETRTVRGGPDGPSIQWEGGWYSSAALQEAGELWGKEVRVFLDPLAELTVRDGRELPAHVALYRLDLTPIGTEPARIHGQAPAWARTDTDRALVGDKLAEQRRRLRSAKQRFQGVTGLPKPLSPGEALAVFARKAGAVPAPMPAPQLDQSASAQVQRPRRVSAAALRKAHALRHRGRDDAQPQPADAGVRDRIARLRAECL